MALAVSHKIESLYDPARERQVILLDCETDAIPFERVRCPDLRSVARAWLDMPRELGELLPRWQSFRPIDFKPMLDKLCVLSVRDWKTDQLEFTLYGGHPTEYIGLGQPLVLQDLRLDPERRSYYRDIRDRAGRAIEHNGPQYARKTLSWNDSGFIDYEVLMLPFMQEGSVQRILQPVSARTTSTTTH